MIRSSEPAPILLSGASAAPTLHHPALALPDLSKETVDIECHRRRRVARQNLLEILSGEAVLVLEEEGAAELQPDPHQLGALDQHGVEGADGLVQQSVPPSSPEMPGFCDAPIDGEAKLEEPRRHGPRDPRTSGPRTARAPLRTCPCWISVLGFG